MTDAVLLIEDMRDGRRELRLVPEGRPVLMGRAVEADVRLPHPSVSALHVRLLFDGSALWAEDLDAQTGSWLGQRRLWPGQPETMREGEALQIGEPFRLAVTQSPSDRQQAIPLAAPPSLSHAPSADLAQLPDLAAAALRQRDLGAGAASAVRSSSPAPEFPPVPSGPAPFLQTMALEPTVLAALSGAALPPRPTNSSPSGHTSIIAAARPEPGAGSLTFSGFTADAARELMPPQVLASAARGRPIEQASRSSAGRERSSGSGGGRAATGRRASGRASTTQPRRKVVRQRRSIWPFLLLATVVLGLGAMAANLFLHGSLPWAPKGESPLGSPAPTELEEKENAASRASPTAPTRSPAEPRAEDLPRRSVLAPPTNTTTQPATGSGTRASKNGSRASKAPKHRHRQAPRTAREHVRPGDAAPTPGAL